MSVRQYIGSRYVTKVYENSLDPSSAEWEANVNYEPLTMVTYNYGSYLSKKEVPASVGNPADNPAYWTQTGFYNGQIAQLNNDVADLQNQIAHLNDRKFIIGSDSYGTPGYGNWVEKLAEYLGVQNDYINCAVDGSSFSNPSYPNLRWLNILQTNTASLTTEEKNAITDIVYLGGINDSLPDAEFSPEVDPAEDAHILVYIENCILDFADYCKTTFPNAIISLGFIGNTVEGIDRREYKYVARAIWAWQNACGQRDNIRFIDNLQYIMHNYAYMMNDSIHPTLDGGDQIARRAASALLGGDAMYDLAFPNRYVDIKTVATSEGLEEHITSINVSGDTDNKGARITNELLDITIGDDYSVEFNNNSSTITITNGDEICIGDLQYKEVVFGKGLRYIPCKVRYYDRSVSPFTYGEFAQAALRIYQGKIYLKVKAVDINFMTTSKNITQFIIQLPHITMNTLLN